MPQSSPTNTSVEPKWVADLVKAEPKAPLMAPFMTYLLLLLLNDLFPTNLLPVAVVLHMACVLWVIWLFRHHYPKWGKPHLVISIIVGLLATGLWVGGQKWLDGIVIGGQSLGYPLSTSWQPPFFSLNPPSEPLINPQDQLGTGTLFWTYAMLKLARAVLVVPIIEELFWRGFILRAFVRWHWFDQVPWGQFAWRAFIGSALLSVLQHPSNWGVSIACWLLYNALFYWKKSLSCLMIVHGVTNLALYIYILYYHDWRFW